MSRRTITCSPPHFRGRGHLVSHVFDNSPDLGGLLRVGYQQLILGWPLDVMQERSPDFTSVIARQGGRCRLLQSNSCFW
jgi:hypothetical protein